MSRDLIITVNLTVPDDADAEEVADFVLDVLCGQEPPTPYESCNGTEWDRAAEMNRERGVGT